MGLRLGTVQALRVHDAVLRRLRSLDLAFPLIAQHPTRRLGRSVVDKTELDRLRDIGKDRCPVCGYCFDRIEETQTCPVCNESSSAYDLIGPDDDYAWVL